MNMSDFNESNIVRDTAGKFGEKAHSAPEMALPTLTPAEEDYKRHDARYWDALRERSVADQKVRDAAVQTFIAETRAFTPDARKAVFHWEDGNDSGHLVFHAYLDDADEEINDGSFPDSGLSDYDDWDSIRRGDNHLEQDEYGYEKFTLDIPDPQPSSTQTPLTDDFHSRSSELYRDFYATKVSVLADSFPTALRENVQHHLPGVSTIAIERYTADGGQDFYINGVTYADGRTLEREQLEEGGHFDQAEEDITQMFRSVMQNEDDMQTAGGSKGQYTATGRDYIFDVGSRG